MLYQNDLVLVRHDTNERTVDSLLTAGLVRASASIDGVELLGGANSFFQEGTFQTDRGRRLNILTLQIEDVDMGRLTSDLKTFVSWIGDVASAANSLLAFIPGGPDNGGDERLEDFLTSLFDEGNVAVAHPLMWFRETLFSGRLCTARSGAYRVFQSAGPGCLFALIDVALDGSFELLEAGPHRADLLQAWAKTPS